MLFGVLAGVRRRPCFLALRNCSHWDDSLQFLWVREKGFIGSVRKPVLG